MMKEKYSILTGVTPSGTGEVHIGNYFGAVLPFLKMAEKAERVYFFIADLHALTTVQNKNQLQKNVENLILSYLSFGIDTNKIIFYRQSDIPQHTELQSILNNVTPLGLIKRCHAYKDKLQQGEREENLNMGLFSYPVLMAADILLYSPDYIPVGVDQKQHVEIARDIAGYFNATYGKVFKMPEFYTVKETSKIIGLDGQRKMSKSLGNYISIFDDEEIIQKQIMSSFTDPNRKKATDPGKVEGNPVFIYHDLINEDKEEVSDLKERYQKGEVGDVEIKQKLFKAHLNRFSAERKAYENLRDNPNMVRKILARNADIVRDLASKKMMEVRNVLGLTNEYSNFTYKKDLD